VFRGRAKEQLGYALSSKCADDEEIRALLSDDLLQLRPQFTAPVNKFVLNASQSAASNEGGLQLCSLAQNRLLASGNCPMTCHPRSQDTTWARQDLDP